MQGAQSHSTQGYTWAHTWYTEVQYYTGVHRDTQGYTGVHRGTQGYTGVHRGTQGYTAHELYIHSGADASNVLLTKLGGRATNASVRLHDDTNAFVLYQRFCAAKRTGSPLSSVNLIIYMEPIRTVRATTGMEAGGETRKI